MRDYVSVGFIMIILFVFCILIPDFIIYGTLNYKANAVVESTIKEAEMQGGITGEVEQEFENFMEMYGLQNKGFEVTYSQTGEIQHLGRIQVSLEGEYRFKAFNLFGTGLGNISLPIVSSDTGRSEVWYR